ncbi:MAG: thioredoxin domain-containing protein [Nanoarchaeota archaeon]
MEISPDTESNKKIIIIGIIIAFFAIALFTNGFGILGLIISPNENTLLEIGGSPVLGNTDAPVTIYEFSDFSCPACALAAGYNQEAIAALKSKDASWEAPLPKIKETYVQEGKVKIVFKYFPGHGTAKAAHLVALALSEQGLFWQFHDKAFENQADTGNIEKMRAIAQEIGANMKKLDEAIKFGKGEELLKKDIAMGKSAGIKGTPSFIINGKLISGAESFAEFKKVIDKELNA